MLAGVRDLEGLGIRGIWLSVLVRVRARDSNPESGGVTLRAMWGGPWVLHGVEHLVG